MDCVLKYIPEHLHTKDKPIVEKFFIGELLYYRCKSGECIKPYDKISLYDISHNRNFDNLEKYPKEDVLFNIIEDDEMEIYHNRDIITLLIADIQNKETYIKEIISKNNPNLKAIIKLKHSPIPCMYPHSVFEISVNDVVITSSNYDQLLNKGNKTHKNLRGDIRQELTSIIQTGSINSIGDIEYIEEP